MNAIKFNNSALWSYWSISPISDCDRMGIARARVSPWQGYSRSLRSSPVKDAEIAAAKRDEVASRNILAVAAYCVTWYHTDDFSSNLFLRHSFIDNYQYFCGGLYNKRMVQCDGLGNECSLTQNDERFSGQIFYRATFANPPSGKSGHVICFCARCCRDHSFSLFPLSLSIYIDTLGKVPEKWVIQQNTQECK